MARGGTESGAARRDVLIGAGALTLLGGKALAQSPAPPKDALDLDAVAAAVGDARVVQLGEPSHGAGSAFAAKARIVEFLHRRMGFDVLVWESGLYDVSLVEAALAAGEPPALAAQRGIFALCAKAQEVQPLFAYAAASHTTARPLRMAGFDLQLTASGVRERFATDLQAFAASAADAGVRTAAADQAAVAISARSRLFADKFANPEDIDALTASAGSLMALIRAHRGAFGRARRLDTEFMEIAIDNMAADARLRFDGARTPAPTTARESRRDATNFRNLRWLLERRYPGRKALIWAHNAHLMDAYYAPDFRVARARPKADDMKPTGVFLKAWLGAEVYTIGFTAFEGEDGFATGGKTTEVSPAPDGSLEALLHARDPRSRFVDLRRPSGPDARLLSQARTARYPKYDLNPIADLPRAYDGLVYLDHVSAATAAPA